MPIEVSPEGLVEESPDGLRALLADFMFEGKALRPAHRRWLDKLAVKIKSRKLPGTHGRWHIVITGRASKSGSYDFNAWISNARAMSVREYLEPQLGGLRVSFDTKFVGEGAPFNYKMTENAKDRSVEVLALVVGSPPPPPIKRKKIDPPPDPVAPRRTKEFEFRVKEYVLRTGEIGIPKTPIGIGWGWFSANIEITDVEGDFTTMYVFEGSGGVVSFGSPFFLGGAKSMGPGKLYIFKADAKLTGKSFEGIAHLYQSTDHDFHFGGKIGHADNLFPKGDIDQFDLQQAIPDTPSGVFTGTMRLGFKDFRYE